MAQPVRDLESSQGMAAAAAVVERAVVPSSLLEIISAALVDPRVDNVEKLGKLLDLQERLDARAAEQEFNRDFAQAALDMPRVTKKGVIDLGGSKGKIPFAKYEDIDRVLRPIEARYGFSRSFSTEPAKDGILMTVCLAHRGGHHVKSTRFMPPDAGPGRNAMQAIGSASSYAKRYLTLDIWNIITEGQDDDASGSDPITDDQLQTIQNMLDELQMSPARMKKFLEFAKADGVAHIQRHRYDEVLLRLKEALEQRRQGA